MQSPNRTKNTAASGGICFSRQDKAVAGLGPAAYWKYVRSPRLATNAVWPPENKFRSGYWADVVSTSDYYPFGMGMVERGDDGKYRYGFNGMQRDDEWQGAGNAYDFGARMYDGRLGRWMSVDPKGSNQPSWSPYKFGLDNPVIYIDPSGETEFYYNGMWIGTDGKENNLVAIVSNKNVAREIKEQSLAGKEFSFPKAKHGFNEGGILIIHEAVYKKAVKVFSNSMSPKGERREFWAVMKQNQDGSYETTHEGVGEEGSGRADGFPEEVNSDVSIHSHNTGWWRNAKGEVESASAGKLSGADIDGVFPRFSLNIVVGKLGKVKIEPDENNQPEVVDNRYGIIDFHTKSGRVRVFNSELFGLSKDSKSHGRIYKKFLKAKDKQEN